MRTLLNTCSNKGLKILADLLKTRLQDQGCKQSFRSAHLSVARRRFAASGYTPCLKSYFDVENLVRKRPALQNQAKHALPCDNLGACGR